MPVPFHYMIPDCLHKFFTVAWVLAGFLGARIPQLPELWWLLSSLGAEKLKDVCTPPLTVLPLWRLSDTERSPKVGRWLDSPVCPLLSREWSCLWLVRWSFTWKGCLYLHCYSLKHWTRLKRSIQRVESPHLWSVLAMHLIRYSCSKCCQPLRLMMAACLYQADVAGGSTFFVSLAWWWAVLPFLVSLCLSCGGRRELNTSTFFTTAAVVHPLLLPSAVSELSSSKLCFCLIKDQISLTHLDP